MARRGFFGEIQHQMKVAAKEQARAERESDRRYNAALRETERARKAAVRAAAQYDRALTTERKRLEKEAKAAHVAAMNAEVEGRNLLLEKTNAELESLLAATLEVDDYVDLEDLRTIAVHPPFLRADLERPLPPAVPMANPAEPRLRLPAQPKGLLGMLGGKRHREAVARAQSRHRRAMAEWKEELADVKAQRVEARAARERAEANRVAALKVERARFEKECAAREAEVLERNSAVDALIANLGYGTTEAIQEYVGIVLSNSVYPEHFPIEYEFVFESATAELQLKVQIPAPETVNAVKAYRYTKTTDTISETALSQKACKDRYAGAVHQVALRTLHEIFEADRRGLIQTISLEVGTETTAPATGREEFHLLVAVAAARDAFLAINLAEVVPTATLEHLGAAVSKNPFGLATADVSGIRRQ